MKVIAQGRLIGGVTCRQAGDVGYPGPRLSVLEKRGHVLWTPVTSLYLEDGSHPDRKQALGNDVRPECVNPKVRICRDGEEC